MVAVESACESENDEAEPSPLELASEVAEAALSAVAPSPLSADPLEVASECAVALPPPSVTTAASEKASEEDAAEPGASVDSLDAVPSA
jgi:hypothetical protein